MMYVYCNYRRQPLGADVSSFAAGRIDSVMNFTEAGQNLYTRLETYPKPIVAAINGPAMGGGFELVLSCDIRIMNKKAQLRLPELNLGLTPGLGGTQRLIRQVGAARAKEIVLLADPVMADKALAWGIVNFVAEADKFEAQVEEIAKKLANGAPLAQKLVKSAFYYGACRPEDGLFIEARSPRSDVARPRKPSASYRRQQNSTAIGDIIWPLANQAVYSVLSLG
jgi:enoyl-CoA hydratase/carnithine racemase